MTENVPSRMIFFSSFSSAQLIIKLRIIYGKEKEPMLYAKKKNKD